MDTLQWLTETEFGKCIFTMLVSMVPIIELRGGLPFGVALGLPYHLAFPAAVLGNLIPAPFIIVYIRRIFELMRKYLPRLNGLVDQLEEKAHLKGQKVQKYQYIGLWLFVAIPLPGTGAWTGSLVAAFLGMRLKKAMPAVTLGVLTAGPSCWPSPMWGSTCFPGRCDRLSIHSGLGHIGWFGGGDRGNAGGRPGPSVCPGRGEPAVAAVRPAGPSGPGA